jgi:hypothetical protein
MAIAVLNAGTVTLTGAVEYAFGTVTTGKTVVLETDMNAMVAGDVIEIRCYTRVGMLSATDRLLFKQQFTDAQGQPNFQSIPVCAPYSVIFRAIQPTGTGRAIPFDIFSID